MPFRTRFDCLWCGNPWTARGPDDLEGWAQLCPDCVGKAGTSRFLRGRVRGAIAERGPASGGPGRVAVGRSCRYPAVSAADHRPPRPSPTTGTCAAAATSAAPSTTPPGMPSSTPSPAGSTAARSPAGSSEPAAGVGFFSPLLAARGEPTRRTPTATRSISPGSACSPTACVPTSTSRTPGPPRRRRRGARAADALVAAFLLGRVRRARLDAAAVRSASGSGSAARSPSSSCGPTPAGGPPPGVRGPGTTPWPSRPRSPGPGSRTWSSPRLAGSSSPRRQRPPEGPDPGGILRRDVPPGEVHDRDRRLRRHGRGDDRRPARAATS